MSYPPKSWLAPEPVTIPDMVERAASPYQTRLAPDAEKEFQMWVRVAGVPFDPSPKADYDMRGFWLAKKTGNPSAQTAVNAADNQMHFPDTWKTPYHRTFSNESKYAQPGAPRWVGDRLVGENGTVLADETPGAER